MPYWDKWIEWMRSSGWKRFAFYVWDQGFGLPGDWNGRLAPSHEFVFHFNKSARQPNKWIEKNPENVKARRPGQSTFREKDGSLKDFTSPEVSAQPNKIPDSVIRVNRQIGAIGDSLDHPAPFSVGLSEFMICTWTEVEQLVYEPFCGSGTSIIACEQLGRQCRAAEISPAYVAVALERWAIATNAQPMRVEA